jgi:hypothetical protein
MTPFEPRFWIVPLLTYFWLTLRRMLFQSSGTTSTLPSAIAWKSGVLSGSFSMLTVHPRFFSSTYLRTYTLAVAPAHAFSSMVTDPQLAPLRPNALAETPSAPTTTSASAASARRTGRALLFDIRPPSCFAWIEGDAAVSRPIDFDVTAAPRVAPDGRRG